MIRVRIGKRESTEKYKKVITFVQSRLLPFAGIRYLMDILDFLGYLIIAIFLQMHRPTLINIFKLRDKLEAISPLQIPLIFHNLNDTTLICKNQCSNMQKDSKH
jgi:hypothetical protein